MNDDDSEIVMAHWHCWGAHGAIGRATGAISDFAGHHGFEAPTLARMSVAVAEALEQVFGPAAMEGAGTGIDAATDGIWLTVRLEGPGRRPAAATYWRLKALADRVELGFDDESVESVAVLLEFCVGAQDGPTRPLECVASRPRPARAPRGGLGRARQCGRRR